MSEDAEYLKALLDGVKPHWDRRDIPSYPGKDGAYFGMMNPGRFSDTGRQRLVEAMLGKQKEIWGDEFRARGSPDYRALPWSKDDPTLITINRPHVEVARKSFWNRPWDW